MNLNGDYHISRPEDDILGRSPFALQLAKAFRNWQRGGSLVAALYGDWGSGKTSVKELMIYHLRTLAREANEHEPTIVDFNPWMFSSAEQITKQFFEALAAKMPVEPGFQHEQAASRLKLFGKVLSLGSSIARVATRLASATSSDPLAVTIFGETVAEAADMGAKVAEAGASVENEQVASVGDLQHLKDEISTLLEKLQRPVIVVIDDIDRLAAAEIRLVMQLVKANANFPKVVYFLLFERSIVVRALDSLAAESGDRYLEKIVQVRLDMPRPDPEALQEALFEEIQSLVSSDQRIARRFSLERLKEVYETGLAPYLHNLRRVFGLVNSLAFHVGVFLRESSFDVDLNDLIALEVLRLFEPEVYRAVARAKAVFMATDNFAGLSDNAEERLELDEKIQTLVPSESRDRLPQIVAIIKHLFPQIEGRFGNFSLYNFVFGIEGLAALRVAHPMVFDRYFQFGVSERIEPRRDIEELLQALGSQSAAPAVIHRLATNRTLTNLLNWLWQHLPDLGVTARENLALALGKCWSALSDKEAPAVTSAVQDQTMSILMWLLLNPSARNSSEKMLEMLLADTDDLRFQGSLLVKLYPEGPEERISMLGRSEVHHAMVTLWLDRVRQRASDGTLADEPALSFLLLLWERWVSKEEPNVWVEKLITTREGTLALVIGCVGYSSTTNDTGHTLYQPFIDLERLQQMLPLDRACEIVASLPLEYAQAGWRREAYAAFKQICRRQSKVSAQVITS